MAGNKAGAEPLNALQQAQVSGRFQLTYFGEGSGKMNDSRPSINRDGYDPRSRGWYQEAMAKGGMIVTKPYLDVAYNILVVTLAQPAQGGVVGDLSIASLVDDITKMKLPADGFAILMHKDGTVIAYKDAAKAMKPASEIDNDLTNALIEQSKASNSLVPAFFDNEGVTSCCGRRTFRHRLGAGAGTGQEHPGGAASSPADDPARPGPAGAGGQHPRHLLAGQPAARPLTKVSQASGPHRRR